MRISQLLNKDSIVSNLSSDNKKSVIRELADAVATTGNASGTEIASVLMEREQLGSTGIGGGIAIPHGKLDQIESIVVGFGLSPNGVEYDSLDGKPVHIFFVLLTSENSTGGHLKVLAQISKMLKTDAFKDKLLSAESKDQIFDVIVEYDEEF